MKMNRILLLSLISILMISSCQNEDGETIVSSEETGIEDVSSSAEIEKKPTRRSLLVNSSPKVIGAHAKLKKDVADLRLELSRLESKRQTPKIQTKIAVTKEQIKFTRNQYISIERNDIKADQVSTEKKIPYTDLMYEQVKIKGLRKKYEDRNDPMAVKRKAELDHQNNLIESQINILLKQ